MSKNNNVNPGQYKVAGRERQGEQINQSVQRQAYAEQQAQTERWQTKQHDDRQPWEATEEVLIEPKATPAPPPAKKAARRRPAAAKAKAQPPAKRAASKKPARAIAKVTARKVSARSSSKPTTRTKGRPNRGMKKAQARKTAGKKKTSSARR